MNRRLLTKIAPALAFCAVTFAAIDAMAWLQICNRRSDGLWASYSSRVRSHEVTWQCNQARWYYDCGGAYFTSWRTRGWWRIEPGKCIKLRDADLTNPYIYLHIFSDDGATLVGARHSFEVSYEKPFSWDSGIKEHKTWIYPPSDCSEAGGSTASHCGEGYDAAFKEIYTKRAKNFTVNVIDANRAQGPELTERDGGWAISVPSTIADRAKAE